MKRMKRNPEKFAALEHYTAIARENGFSLFDADDLEKFSASVIDSLKGAQAEPTMLHGKRIEALFGYVAGALGKCELIKVEDAGEVFSADAKVQAPDYKIILKTGERMLVEVKNFWAKDITKPFRLSYKAFERLERYAHLDGIPLKIAVYFANFGLWTLLSPGSFCRTEHGLEITMISAIAKNEMATLGDAKLATLPEIRLELMGNPDEANLVIDGQAMITFRSSKIFSGGVELVDQPSQRIAFYLMQYGGWDTTSVDHIVEDGKLQGSIFTASTKELCDGQPFAIIGDLSSMIGRAFTEHTVRDGQVRALDVPLDPEAFAPGIPANFKGVSLSLWGFIIQPNLEFEDNITKQLQRAKWSNRRA